MNELTLIPSEESKHCAYFFEPPDPRAGQRCRAFHVDGSEFCFPHSGGIEKMQQMRARAAVRKEEIVQKLQTGGLRLQSVEDVVDTYELMINAICTQAIGGDQAKLIVFTLPGVLKAIKERKGPKSTGQVSLELSKEGAKITAAFSNAQELDAFLQANESHSIEILDQLKDAGRLRLRKPTIEIEAKQIDVDKERMPIAELAKISEDSNSPLTKKQASNLFGKLLGDKLGKSNKIEAILEADTEGIEQVFDGNEFLPIEAQDRPHSWKMYLEPTGAGNGVVAKRFKCQGCGTTANRKLDDVCSSPIPINYEEITND